MIDISSYGSLIYASLLEKLHLHPKWANLEADIAVLCSRMPQTDSSEKKDLAILVLQDLKKFLEKELLLDKDLSTFLQDEIDRFEGTVEIVKTMDKENFVPDNVIQKYAALSYGTEGVMGVHVAYNVQQLLKLSQGVYNLTKCLRFYISPEICVSGKIVGEAFEFPQDLPLCKVAMLNQKKVDDGAPKPEIVFYFGEKCDPKKWITIKEVTAKMWIYRFVSDQRQEYVLLSNDRLIGGDYIITGFVTDVQDLKNVSETLKIQTNFPHLFVHSAKDKILKYATPEDFVEKLELLDVTKNNLLDYPFGVKLGEVTRVLIYPEWFKWLVWSWLVHSKQGITSKYPLHLLLLGNPQSGKTSLLNNLYSKTLEVSQPFSGVSSTFKDLIPSFKQTIPKRGYLAESNRFSFADEFLRCITRSSTNQDMIDEQVALMNDLLEHQRRRAGSGNGSTNINMRSRVLAVTNPVRAIKNITELIEKHDRSFLSRWLIYWQPEEMVKIARNATEKDLKILDYKISDIDFVSMIDYLQAAESKYDSDKVMEVFNLPKKLLSETLLDHYTARHRHHIQCVMDGIIKTRCLFEHKTDFIAIDADYDLLSIIWANIVKSWIDGEGIEKIDIKYRHHYLPETSQFAYKVLCGEKRLLTRLDTEELLCKDMTKTEYITAMIILQRAGLIVQEGENIRLHWLTWVKENAE